MIFRHACKTGINVILYWCMGIGSSRQQITYVEPGSPAARKGIVAGEWLLSCNGESVLDLIDYEKLTSERNLLLVLEREGKLHKVHIRKQEYEPLGLCFETSLMSLMQTCRNHCIFCFIDQMPKGVRSSLQVKDDDWRLSFIMGNYVSLTNVDDAEFQRILKRRVSPLFVSVHATDPETRIRMMRNPNAGKLMERLTALKEHGIRFHAQIVLCKDINDGEILRQSMTDLADLYPACTSVAVVPVGLTRFRDGLNPLIPFDREASREVIGRVEALQKEFLAEHGTRLCFLSDEWYLNAELPIPCDACYEGYEQIENGVGLLRLFATEFYELLAQQTPREKARTVHIAGGTAASQFFKELYGALHQYNISVQCHPIKNEYFGGNVHVAGLVTGSDLIKALQGNLDAEELLIPHNMLREKEDVFLDGMTLLELENRLSLRVRAFFDASELISILFEE